MSQAVIKDSESSTGEVSKLLEEYKQLDEACDQALKTIKERKRKKNVK